MECATGNPEYEVTGQGTDEIKGHSRAVGISECKAAKMALNQEESRIKAVRRGKRSKRYWGRANEQLQTSTLDTCPGFCASRELLNDQKIVM